MHHFKVLPTDLRFKELTELQKQLLYVGYMDAPTPEQLHDVYQHSKQSDVSVTKEDADHLAKLGYSPAQIRKMREQLQKAGLG